MTKTEYLLWNHVTFLATLYWIHVKSPKRFPMSGEAGLGRDGEPVCRPQLLTVCRVCPISTSVGFVVTFLRIIGRPASKFTMPRPLAKGEHRAPSISVSPLCETSYSSCLTLHSLLPYCYVASSRPVSLFSSSAMPALCHRLLLLHAHQH